VSTVKDIAMVTTALKMVLVHQFGPTVTREGAAESLLNGEDGHSVR